MQRPSISILFPYTTLFRSLKDDGKRFYADPFPFRYRGEDFIFMEEFPYRNGRGHISVCTVSGDRKSTRLNSSHSSISYAVFCLKKKIKTLFTFFFLVIIIS